MAYIEIQAEIQADGMLHVSVPDALPGDRVKVTIEKEEAIAEIEEVDGKPVRVFGQFKGRIRMHESFWDPIKLG